MLQRISSGDPATWNDIVHRYQPCLSAQAARFRLSPEDRQDLEQRVWLRLLEHVDQIRDAACLPGWLATTARREALRMVRRDGREVSMGSADDTVQLRGYRPPWPTTDIPPIDHALLVAEDVAEVDRALSELPPKQRAVLRALSEDEISYQEVSERLGIPVGSIGPTRGRALVQLRRRISA